MNYYIHGDAANADKIKAAFEELGVASNANRYNYKNDYMLYFSAGGMMNMIDANGSWANIIKTHPDYKELELPVEPKFKVGDWLVYKNGNCFAGGLTEAQVVKVKDGVYSFASGTTGSFKFIDECCRLWTIQDAKDGDVLSYQDEIFIARIARGLSANVAIDYDCCYDGNSFILDSFYSLTVEELKKVYPATKEQRDLLFVKMKEAGYEWDADKKELHKIKPHYDIANFKPFDKVLVRCSNDEEWMIEFYCKYDTLVYTSPHRDYPFMGIGDSYSQCIPFEGNEHLLGTTDMCDEQYINW